MNRSQREPYLGLTRIVVEAPYIQRTKEEEEKHSPLVKHPFYMGNLALCHFCKFARWWGAPCLDEVELDCVHPLAFREQWEPLDVWEGDGTDCWGFRPDVDIDEAADILGIYLRGEWI